MFGKYGTIKRLVVNQNTQDKYKSQCGVYVEYEDPKSVVIAIECLSKFKLNGFSVKCSFGTSKYCKKFL